MKYGATVHNFYTFPVLRYASHGLQNKTASGKTNGGFLLPKHLRDYSLNVTVCIFSDSAVLGLYYETVFSNSALIFCNWAICIE